MKRPFFVVIVTVLLFIFACNQSVKVEVVTESSMRDSTQLVFWKNLGDLYGKAFRGTVVAGGDGDTTFAGELVMHVRLVEGGVIKVPFIVGKDSSRTWIFTLESDGLMLNHDHRHPDGTESESNMYGGKTTNFGTAECQVFPVDQATVNILPTRTTNVWWVELVPGSHFTYNLRRVNTDRFFSVRFDLTQEIETPGVPWGW